MAKTLTIAGVNHLPYYKSNSVKIKEMLRKSNVMNFQTVTKSISNAPQEGAELVFKDGSRFLFAGYISKVDPTEVGKGSLFTFNVEVSDYSYIFNNKIARRAYANETLKDIVEDLLDAYVDTGYGFTTTNVDTGPTIETISFDHLSIRKCFEKLSKLTGYVWWTDYEKNIYFKSQQSEAAPEAFTDAGTNLESVDIAYDTSQVRNSVIVIGSSDGVQSLDLITQTFTGDGETTSWALEEKPSQVTALTINGVARNYGIDDLPSPTNVFEYAFEGKTLTLTGNEVPYGSSATGTAGYTATNTAWVGRDVTVTGASELIAGITVDLTELSSVPDGDVVVGIRSTADRSGADLASKTYAATGLVVGQNTIRFDEPIYITRGSSYFVYFGRSGSTVGTIKVKEETLASNDEYTSSDSGGTFALGASNKLIDIKAISTPEPTPTEADTVSISYYPRIPIVEVKQDATSIAFFAALDGGDGVYEYTIKEGAITSLEEASQRAVQELEEFSMPLVNGRIITRTGLLSGGSVFKPGQYITVTFATYGLSTPTAFLIQEMNLSFTEDGTNTEYQYSIRFGGKIVGVQEFLESLASQQSEDETPDAVEIVTIEHVTDVLVFDDTAPTTSLVTPPYEWGAGGSPQAVWNIFEWS